MTTAHFLPRADAAGEDPLRAARSATLGVLAGRIPSDKDLATPAALLADGWTPAIYERIAALGNHVMQTRTWLLVGFGDRNQAIADAERRSVEEIESPIVTYRLIRSAELAVKKGTTIEQVEPWLRVLAGETDRVRGRMLYEGFCWLPGGGNDWLPICTWVEAGPLAALAWAAGLSIKEAETREAVGTPREATADLRALAALRGYRLPGGPGEGGAG